jgi:hypothetical protein
MQPGSPTCSLHKHSLAVGGYQKLLTETWRRWKVSFIFQWQRSTGERFVVGKPARLNHSLALEHLWAGPASQLARDGRELVTTKVLAARHEAEPGQTHCPRPVFSASFWG